MIVIKESKTADTRTCNVSLVSRSQLIESSKQHIEDVKKGLELFSQKLIDIGKNHDSDKLTDIDQFYADFITKFSQTIWWDKHRKITRHHILADDGVPDDVNLLDVLEMIVDCVMAGMGRTGEVYPLNIEPEVLMKSFQNTVEMLKSQVIVDRSEE